MKSKFAAMWKKDGRASENAKRWAKLRSDMQDAFPTYYSTQGQDAFADLVGEAIRQLNLLKPQPDGPGYLGGDPSGPHYGQVTQAELAPGMEAVVSVLKKSINLFKGMSNWNHPRVMPNVIPPANTAAIIAAMMTNVFSPNIIEGEYAWDVERSEMESAAIIARLIGWNPEEAGGLFTFGGSGCYFYGLKYALTRVLGDKSRCQGIRTNAKLLVSQQGHYCMMNSTDWTGLGMDNIVTIRTDKETNAMDLNHLEEQIQYWQSQGVPIASIICTMGTTDAFAMDPVDKVRELINKYPNPGDFGAPFLYCDAVIGWSWLTFKNYDFQANPLGFEDEILPFIQKNYEMISKVHHADAIGCDFHKTGWATYNCSIFMMRDLNDFRNRMTRPGSAYLQERTCYNPGLYTLEVSRSGSYSMAAWATLKFLGHEGFQAILGGILEMQQYLREDLIKPESTAVCVNADDHGFVTLFRVYPQGVNAEEQYEKELTDPAYKDDLIKHNILQKDVADKLWQWFRDGELHKVNQENPGYYGPYTSYTSGFRTTDYDPENNDKDAVIYALKSYPMNVNINAEAMDILLELVLAARDDVMAGNVTPPVTTGDCPLPYSKHPDQVIDCESTKSPRTRAALENLLSGIGF